MVRTLAASLVALVFTASAAYAGERPETDPVAPSAAVAAAWKREAPKPAPALRALFVSYAVAQGLDMATTIRARNLGAVEANPVLGTSYVQAFAVKATLGTVTILAMRSMGKTHRKTAIITMLAANAATVAVAAHNLRIAGQLKGK
jgi:hypothetical protein